MKPHFQFRLQTLFVVVTIVAVAVVAAAIARWVFYNPPPAYLTLREVHELCNGFEFEVKVRREGAAIDATAMATSSSKDDGSELGRVVAEPGSSNYDRVYDEHIFPDRIDTRIREFI